MFKNVGILGLGLIGGSLARALKKYNYGTTIYGYNRNQTSLEHAYDCGTIDIKVTDFSQFANCDLLVLCCPVNINIILFKQLLPYLKDDTVVTDVGSTKNDIYEALSLIPHKGFFIGGHPMAGSEKTGFSATKAELFENAYYILTPEDHCPENLTDKMIHMAKTIDAIPVILDPKKHDYIVAAISHVPHILATTLVNMVEDLDGDEKEMYKLAAGGFKDFTRIASASPEMWQQICLANKDRVIDVLNSYIEMLGGFKDAISKQNSSSVYSLFEQSKNYRNTFQNKIRGSIDKVYALSINILDETGAIASIATLLAKHNISIKNIGINNNRENYEGVLEIVFYDQKSIDSAIIVIQDQGYEVIEN